MLPRLSSEAMLGASDPAQIYNTETAASRNAQVATVYGPGLIQLCAICHKLINVLEELANHGQYFHEDFYDSDNNLIGSQLVHYTCANKSWFPC